MIPLVKSVPRRVSCRTRRIFRGLSEGFRGEFSLYVKVLSGSVLSLAILNACGFETHRQEQAQFTAGDATPQDVGLRRQVDPWEIVIEAERWTVMIDRAHNGLMSKLAEDTRHDEDDLLRIDSALRNGVLNLIALRDDLCRSDQAPLQTCKQIDIPDWVMSPPDRVTTLREYEARSQWLGAALQDLVDVGCAIGRESTKNEYFCAVE